MGLVAASRALNYSEHSQAKDNLQECAGSDRRQLLTPHADGKMPDARRVCGDATGHSDLIPSLNRQLAPGFAGDG